MNTWKHWLLLEARRWSWRQWKIRRGLFRARLPQNFVLASHTVPLIIFSQNQQKLWYCKHNIYSRVLLDYYWFEFVWSIIIFEIRCCLYRSITTSCCCFIKWLSKGSWVFKPSPPYPGVFCFTCYSEVHYSDLYKHNLLCPNIKVLSWSLLLECQTKTWNE